jgi:hypothetical protein
MGPIWDNRETSACTAMARLPKARIDEQVSRAASSRMRKLTAMSAPAEASASAQPFPTPRAAPVMSATFPSRGSISKNSFPSPPQKKENHNLTIYFERLCFIGNEFSLPEGVTHALNGLHLPNGGALLFDPE